MQTLKQKLDSIFKAKHPDITLSNGRVVTHKPYLSGGVPNGAAEAFMLDNGEMSDAEWSEYVKLKK
jgi:hypothetical protein